VTDSKRSKFLRWAERKNLQTGASHNCSFNILRMKNETSWWGKSLSKLQSKSGSTDGSFPPVNDEALYWDETAYNLGILDSQTDGLFWSRIGTSKFKYLMSNTSFTGKAISTD
jgi:hypothetical protein